MIAKSLIKVLDHKDLRLPESPRKEEPSRWSRREYERINKKVIFFVFFIAFSLPTNEHLYFIF